MSKPLSEIYLERVEQPRGEFEEILCISINEARNYAELYAIEREIELINSKLNSLNEIYGYLDDDAKKIEAIFENDKNNLTQTLNEKFEEFTKEV